LRRLRRGIRDSGDVTGCTFTGVYIRFNTNPGKRLELTAGTYREFAGGQQVEETAASPTSS
jgi:hypothetical protein